MTGTARRLLSVACLGVLALALASSASRAAEEEKRRQSYTVSEPVYKRINEAIEQLGEERYVEAHATLTALSRKSLNCGRWLFVRSSVARLSCDNAIRGTPKSRAINFKARVISVTSCVRFCVFAPDLSNCR